MRKQVIGLLLIAAPLAVPDAGAALIDFETVPGAGAPFEGMTISDQYAATEGVTFSLLGGGAPVIAEVGPPTTAFQGPPNHNGSDNPIPGQGIGQFFLTDDGETAGLEPQPLVVSYDPPASEASGVILDMDVDERFTIDVRNGIGEVIETVVIHAGDPLTGDGVATPWNIVRAQADIASITFTGDRDHPGFFGLGFDRFDARAAPDSDGDGVFDNADNCVEAANAGQRDSDGDGFGNWCDGDLNNDCIVNTLDLGLFKSLFFSADEDADFNGDGVVNALDLGVLRLVYFQPPGPTSWPNGCE